MFEPSLLGSDLFVVYNGFFDHLPLIVEDTKFGSCGRLINSTDEDFIHILKLYL